MLVQIDLKDNLNEVYADRGVHFSTSESDDENVNRVFMGITDPEHEFWKQHYPNGAKQTRVLYAIEDKRPGVYWGWNFDNTIRDYFNCDLVCRFAEFDLAKGIYYTIDEIRESFSTEDAVLSTGKETPTMFNLAGSYGVCDTVEQVLERYKNVINNSDNQIVISFAPIKKSEQPEHGGWRWHKWGQYIGTHTPTHEYLYDEKDIDEVLIFHVLVVKLN